MSFLGKNFLIFFLCLASIAEASIFCGQILNPKSKEESIAEARQQAQDLLTKAQRGESVSGRNFISSFPPRTPELLEEAAKNQITWWGVRIFFANSIEEARQHSMAEPERDQLLQGIYIIIPQQKNSSDFQATLRELTDLSAKEALQKYLNSAVIVNFNYHTLDLILKGEGKKYAQIQDGIGGVKMPEPTVERIDPRFLIERFDANSVYWSKSDAGLGPFLVQPGWTLGLAKGHIPLADTLTAKAYKDAREIAQKNRWHVTFNTDPEGVMNMIRDQWRLASDPNHASLSKDSTGIPANLLAHTPKNKKWVQNSRYKSDPSLYNQTLAALKSLDAKTIAVEVRNEQNELIGGMLLLVSEGVLYEGDTVFYDNAKYPVLGVEIPRVALVATKDRLYSSGIPILGAGAMTSKFSRSMGAYLITNQELQAHVDQLKTQFPNGAPADFKTPWSPSEHSEAALRQQQSEQNKGPKKERPALTPEEREALKQAALSRRAQDQKK